MAALGVATAVVGWRRVRVARAVESLVRGSCCEDLAPTAVIILGGEVVRFGGPVDACPAIDVLAAAEADGLEPYADEPRPVALHTGEAVASIVSIAVSERSRERSP